MTDDLDLQEMLTNPAWGRWLQSLGKVHADLQRMVVVAAQDTELDKIRFLAGRAKGFEEVLRLAEKLRASD